MNDEEYGVLTDEDQTHGQQKRDFPLDRIRATIVEDLRTRPALQQERIPLCDRSKLDLQPFNLCKESEE